MNSDRIQVDEQPDGRVRIALPPAPRKDFETWDGIAQLGCLAVVGCFLAFLSLNLLKFPVDFSITLVASQVVLVAWAVNLFRRLPLMGWEALLERRTLTIVARQGEREKRTVVPIACLRRLVLARLPPGAYVGLPAPSPYGNLMLECTDGLARRGAIRYPISWLRAFAAEIALRVDAMDSVEESSSELFLDSADNDDYFPGTILAQPVGGRGRLDQSAEALSIEIAPIGIGHGSKRLTGLPLALGLISVTLGVVSVLLWTSPIWRDPHAFVLVPLIFLGTAIKTTQVTWRRLIEILRSATLSVREGKLSIVERTPSGADAHEWKRDEIRTIECEGDSVREFDVGKLIVATDERRWMLLRGHDIHEVAWIVTRLRDALGLAPPEQCTVDLNQRGMRIAKGHPNAPGKEAGES